MGLLCAALIGLTGAGISIALHTGSASGAPVVLVQHPTRQTTADFPPNTDFVVPWTVAPTAGDTFLVTASHYCSVHPSSTPVLTSDPGGWTEVNHARGTAEGGFMWGKLIVWRWTGAGVPGSIAIQMHNGTSSCDLNVAAFEYRGLAANPIDINQQATFNGRPAPWTLPTVTPSQSNELLFIAVGSRASGPWVTSVTPEFTLQANTATSGGTSNMGIAVADRILSTGGSYTPVVSFCGGCGAQPGAVILGLRAAGGGTTTSTSASTSTTQRATTTNPATTTVPATTTTTTTKATTTTMTTVPNTFGCPCSIFANGVPTIAAATDSRAVDVGVKFRSDVGGYVRAIRFYKGPGNTGVHTGGLWSSTGTKLATVTFAAETAGGWQSASFAAPVPIVAGTTYVASYHMNVGHYPYTYNGLTNQVDKPPLHALGSVASGGNGVFLYGSTVQFPNQTSQSTNYWVDLTFTTNAT
ncbi:MAG: hypothetical protein QOE62_1241 [Actinomycetota bacterium]|nr:hypothetical protein [Actinomycetota bacterium]